MGPVKLSTEDMKQAEELFDLIQMQMPCNANHIWTVIAIYLAKVKEQAHERAFGAAKQMFTGGDVA